MLEFHGEIIKPEKFPNAACIQVVGDVKATFGRANPKVKIYFDGHLYRGSISNMGWGPMVVMPQAVRKKVKKIHGDTVHVRIELDTEERIIEIPPELEELFKSRPELQAVYDKWSYTKRKELARSISEAKRPETKAKRLAKGISLLESNS